MKQSPLAFILALAAFATSFFPVKEAKASLIIYVYETPSDVIFKWNGTIGDSGPGTGETGTAGSADFADPNDTHGSVDYALYVADKTLNGGAQQWAIQNTYNGTTAPAFGSGNPFTHGTVTGGGIPFGVRYPGRLHVGTAESLSTAVFAGTYTVSGSLSSLGLFDTVGTASPLVLWESDVGSGSIVFAVVPEPTTMLGMGGLMMAAFLRRKRRRIQFPKSA